MKCYQFNNVKIKAIYLILSPILARQQIHPTNFIDDSQKEGKNNFFWKQKQIWAENPTSDYGPYGGVGTSVSPLPQ